MLATRCFAHAITLLAPLKSSEFGALKSKTNFFENTSSISNEINRVYIYVSENKIVINNFIDWIQISDLSGKVIYRNNKLMKGDKISIQSEKLHIVEFFSDEKYFSNKIYIQPTL